MSSKFTMSIKFTKIIDGKEQDSQFGSERGIRGCFEPCTDAIRDKVAYFLDRKQCKCMTLSFKAFKVRLEKR